MPHRQEDHLVKCPYYKTHTRQVLFCEGLEDGMSVHLAFSTHGQLIDYKGRFCRKDCWAECFLAKDLNRKWDYK